jgi:hypothetical protein
VIICGTRLGVKPDLVRDAIVRLKAAHPDLVVVQGAAQGVDTQARCFAMQLDVPCEAHPARWKELGVKAGPIRNQEMLDSGVDEVVAFPAAAESRGTDDMIRRALGAGVPVTVLR